MSSPEARLEVVQECCASVLIFSSRRNRSWNSKRFIVSIIARSPKKSLSISRPATGVLVDKFHHKNVYFIVKRDEHVVGMVSAHDQPPFSVADRLPDAEILYKDNIRPLEVRLLAIEPSERNSTLFFGLIWTLYAYAQRHGYTHLFISGVEQARQDFTSVWDSSRWARRSGAAKRRFVPMVQIVGQLPEKLEHMKKMWENRLEKVAPKPRTEPVCLLPGPVTMSREVREAFSRPPIYHRGPEFIDRFVKVRHLLGDMVGGRDVAILNGSGTLANETIAATLAAGDGPGRGVLLTNGEFGERIASQATRFALNARNLSWSWGEPWDLDEIDAALADEPAGSWVWGVHQESSTGVLNDLPGLVRDCPAARTCASASIASAALGPCRWILSEVYLASGATGKSLGSYAGSVADLRRPRSSQRSGSQASTELFRLSGGLGKRGAVLHFPVLDAGGTGDRTPSIRDSGQGRGHLRTLSRPGQSSATRIEATGAYAAGCGGMRLAGRDDICASAGEESIGEIRQTLPFLGLRDRRRKRLSFQAPPRANRHHGGGHWDMFSGLFHCFESWLAKHTAAETLVS